MMARWETWISTNMKLEDEQINYPKLKTNKTTINEKTRASTVETMGNGRSYNPRYVKFAKRAQSMNCTHVHLAIQHKTMLWLRAESHLNMNDAVTGYTCCKEIANKLGIT